MTEEEQAELEELRRRRLASLQAQAGGVDPSMAAAQQAEADRRSAEQHELLRRILTPEARERLGRIRLAKPEVAQAVEQQILALAASRRLSRMIDDDTLRQILERVMPEKRDITITRR